MVTVARLGAIGMLFLALAVSAQTPQPSFTLHAGGVVAATLPLAILEDPRVKKQLANGLTTTFLLVARQRDPAEVSGARMEVRYDLWDEVWLARRIEFDGRVERQRFASREALERWWRSPVRLLTSDGTRVLLQIDLNVLPFSAAEEEDARRWISKAGGVATGGGGLVQALIGTTISAKPITSFRWNVDLTLR